MPFSDLALTWVKILFPLAFLVGFNLWPLDQRVCNLSQTLNLAARDGRPAMEAATLARLSAWQPWRVDLLEQMGRVAYRLGNYPVAIVALRQAEPHQALARESRIVLAESLQQTGQYALAGASWQELEAGSSDPTLYAREAEAWRQAGELDQAIRVLRAWQAFDPLNADVDYNLGLLLAVSSPELAVGQLNEAARLDPQYGAALDTLQRAMSLAELNDDHGYQYTVIGRGLASLAAWDLAEASFQAAVRANPDYAEAWALLGEARAQRGENGMPDLEKAIAVNPDSVMAHALMALALGRQEQWDEAIAQLEQAARLEPTRAVWRIGLGNLTAQAGDLVTARSEFEAAVELEPNDAQTWYALAAFCYQYGVDLEETGEPAARKAAELDDQDASAQDLLGAILVDLGQEEEGEQVLQKALAMDGNLASVHLHLAGLYLQRGEMDLAYQHFSQAARLDPQGQNGLLAQRAIQRYFPAEAP